MQTKFFSLAALALLCLAQLSIAAPLVAKVTVTSGPMLARKSLDLGASEITKLTAELKQQVEQQLAAAGMISKEGGEVSLQIIDATPNRATEQQLKNTPGLSAQFFGVGGAVIVGSYTAASGARVPLNFRWYETNVAHAINSTTWTDASSAFKAFAMQLPPTLKSAEPVAQ